MSFTELRLAEPIVRAVATEGYTHPTPIQTKAIPEILSGHDVLGCAQTGTGKTGAFALPILHRLAESAGNTSAGRRRRSRTPGGRPRGLVLCPTRELATQIYESFRGYGRNLPLRHAVIFGGVKQASQVRALDAGVDVLVATPGRLLDLVDQGIVDLRGIEVFVLDEADRMLDMGFIRDIRKVVDIIPTERQTLLFSATMPDEIRRLADTILIDPVFVQTARVASTAESIEQSVYMVVKKNKPALLARVLRNHDVARTLVFTRTKYGADRVVKNLRRAGIESAAIHGNKAQNARTRALDGFKSGKIPVLVATDIASRGIDVDEITHVVNFDLPNIPETYVHRIGRTARAGASGIAVSFCDVDEIEYLHAIEDLTGVELTVSDDEPELLYEAPKRTERNGRTGRRSSSGSNATKGRGKHRGRGPANAKPGGSRNGTGRSRRRRSRSGAGTGQGSSSPTTSATNRRPRTENGAPTAANKPRRSTSANARPPRANTKRPNTKRRPR